MVTAVPRSEVFGTKLPVNNDGSPRPLLAPNRPYYTIHYTGANAVFADFDDSAAEIRGIETYASSSVKRTPWEYNWPIDTQGRVWTYAGEYQAAHSAGENSLSHGVILLLGNGEAPTDAMIDATRRLRHELVQENYLAPDHQMLQHRQMPGASTSCPGDKVIARWNEFTAPYIPNPAPPPEPPNPGAILELHSFGKFQISTSQRWPYAVSQYLYGNGNLWPWITNFNGINPDLNGWPPVGNWVNVPGLPPEISGRSDTLFAGATIKVPGGTGAAGIIGLLYPNESYAQRLARVPLQLQRWNMGRTSFGAGEIIFVEVKP